MIQNLKSLVEKLNDTTRRALEAAAGMCLSKTHHEVEVEHWLLKLLESTDNDLGPILQASGVDRSRLVSELSRTIDRLKTGNSRSPSLSLGVLDLMKDAWLVSSVELGEPKVRSGALLLTVLSGEGRYRNVRSASKELEAISPEALTKAFAKITENSSESGEARAAAASQGGERPAGGRGGKTDSLDQFTIDMTAKAKEGKIDPVLGRDPEIRQVVDILIRRRQNNPILTGEPGVGKTAVVEGFALRISAGDVPEPLKNVRLLSLDLGLLQAGAGVKGEFENRLKSVIQEVKSSAQPIILFIDEAHQLVGAGGSAGQGDAANLLKPALARGELRTIAATTWAEYKKYFEKDAALARRFQVVKVEEPSEETAIKMMRGLVRTLEDHHKVRVLDEGVEDAVRLSHRYITGRQLPDKCVSVLDTACSKVAIAQVTIPGAIEDLQRAIRSYQVELEALQREQAIGTDHGKRMESLGAEKAQCEARLSELETRWKREKELVQSIRSMQSELESAAVAEIGGPKAKDAKKLAPADATRIRADLKKAENDLHALRGDSQLVPVCVDRQAVAEVISGWTGIPVGRMLKDEISTVLSLQDILGRRVIGQGHALEAISKRIQTSRARLDNPSKPIGVFMLVGPSGVGKTETAISLAEALYGGERNLVTINMSEYQEAHTVSLLKGSPPGYVGYGEGGVLTEAVRRKPYSVVLLDEVEKAHSDVHELFFQVFDKGVMEDGEGRDIDFKNTVILLTSNAGSATIQKVCADPDTRPEPEKLAAMLRDDLLKVFPAAFLGRVVVVPYYPISDVMLDSIIRLQLERIRRRVEHNHGVPFSFDDSLVKAIAKRCTEVESGARNVDHILTHTVLPAISKDILAKMAEGLAMRSVRVTAGPDGQFQHFVE